MLPLVFSKTFLPSAVSQRICTVRVCPRVYTATDKNRVSTPVRSRSVTGSTKRPSRPTLLRANQRGEDAHDDHRRDDMYQQQLRNYRQERIGNRKRRREREHEREGHEEAEVPYGPPSIVIFLISSASLSAKRPGLRPARLSTDSLSSAGFSLNSFEERTGRDSTPRPVRIVYELGLYDGAFETVSPVGRSLER